MIPYFEWTTIAIGPLTIYVWGLFVALGFIAGSLVAGWMARKRGQDSKVIYDFTAWAMVAGLVGGRLGHVLLYDPAYYMENPIKIFSIWEGGLSVFGGFIAAAIVGVIYFKTKKLNVWAYADSAIFGLPVGLFIGRIGCFLIHDHPGTATNFILGVEYPDQIVRHDHGLYLSLNGLALALVFLWLSRKKQPIGVYLAVFSIWYGVVRFMLDFLRTIDVKYFSLTPAQYLSVALVVFGVWMAIKTKKK
ncbi:MAG: prolipoprotein diacylglyceryl transferase [Candidatus Uhrbacteria bacterium]|nr:prolipoprotein diacylglyceryl transferase [Candidatus Uhrbacteria bacterium]